MNLKTNSWHARYFKWFWNTSKLPNNSCDYFWGLVGAIILIIPFWSAPLMSKNATEKTKTFHFTVSILLSLVFCSFGMAVFVYKDENIISDLNLWKFLPYYIIGVIITILVALCGYIISSVLIKVIVFFETPLKIQKPSIVKEYIKNLKERSCSMIKWKNE